MYMWDTPFDVSFLYDKRGVVVRCPEEWLADDLFEILEEAGIRWANGDMSVTRWDGHREDTAYFIKGRQLLYGPYEHADTGIYRNYIKCTFCGAGSDPLQDVEVDEEELLAVLNA